MSVGEWGMRMSGVCVGGGGSKDHDQGQDTIPVRRSGIGRYLGWITTVILERWVILT